MSGMITARLAGTQMHSALLRVAKDGDLVCPGFDGVAFLDCHATVDEL
ncbi:hypothetical protein [Nonomuraea sp. MG754425]